MSVKLRIASEDNLSSLDGGDHLKAVQLCWLNLQWVFVEDGEISNLSDLDGSLNALLVTLPG